MSLKIQLSADRFKDVPHITTNHLGAQGYAHTGCKLLAHTNVTVYLDKAEVTTVILEYARMHSKMKKIKETIAHYFANTPALDKKTPTFLSFPGPIFRHEGILPEEYHTLVQTVDGYTCYPSVKSWTWKQLWEVPDGLEAQELMTSVQKIVTDLFPNQKKAELEPEVVTIQELEGRKKPESHVFF